MCKQILSNLSKELTPSQLAAGRGSFYRLRIFPTSLNRSAIFSMT